MNKIIFHKSKIIFHTRNETIDQWRVCRIVWEDIEEGEGSLLKEYKMKEIINTAIY